MTTHRVTAAIPVDWAVADDLPDQVQILATAPEPVRGILANLVVVTVDAPDTPTERGIDAYVVDVVRELDDDPDVTVVDVLVDHATPADPDAPIHGPVRQRILMERRFVDERGSHLATAEVCQQHEWLGSHVVVSTVTLPVPVGEDDDLAGAALDAQLLDDALACLDSVRLEPCDEGQPTVR